MAMTFFHNNYLYRFNNKNNALLQVRFSRMNLIIFSIKEKYTTNKMLLTIDRHTLIELTRPNQALCTPLLTGNDSH